MLSQGAKVTFASEYGIAFVRRRIYEYMPEGYETMHWLFPSIPMDHTRRASGTLV
jgi:hypothetical protein